MVQDAPILVFNLDIVANIFPVENRSLLLHARIGFVVAVCYPSIRSLDGARLCIKGILLAESEHGLAPKGQDLAI